MIVKYQEEDGKWFVSYAHRITDYAGAEEIGMDDPLVTVTRIVDMWCSELEGANLHSLMDVPGTIAKRLREEMPEDAVKRTMWKMFTDDGGFI